MRVYLAILCASLLLATAAIASSQGFRALHDYSFDEFPDHIVFRTGAFRVPVHLKKGWDEKQATEESERLVKYQATKAHAAEATSELAQMIHKHSLTRQYLVHIQPFDSAVAESDPSAVRDAIQSVTGQEPVYMPHNTFLIYANPEIADKISKLPRVLWIGQMPAEHKYTSDVHINPDHRPAPRPIGDNLASADGVAVMSTPAAQPTFSTLSEEPLVECTLRDTNRVVPGWRRLRVKFLSSAFDHPKEGGVMMTKFVSEWHTSNSRTSASLTLLVCHACDEVALILVKESLVRQAVQALSALEWVETVENLSIRRVKNRDAQWIVQSGVTNSRPVWNRGLRGTGQIVGVGDTGLDYTHCSFRDTAVPFDSLVCSTCTSASAFPCTMSTTNCLQPRVHRKLVGYWRFVDNLDYIGGHGTHVAGSVAANASPNTADSVMIAHNGMADQAKIVFTDIGDSGGNLDIPPNLSRDYFQYPYNMGARIHTNSWGGSFSLGYSTDSIQLDTYTNNFKDMLVLFAGGNDGDSGVATIDPEGQAKNILTVGAGGVPSTHLATDAEVKATTEWIDLRRVACTLASATPYNGELYTSTATVCSNLLARGASPTYTTCATLQTASCNLFAQHDYCCTIASATAGTGVAGAWKYLMRNNFQITRSCCLRERQQLGLDGNSDAAIDKVAYFSSRGPTSDGRIKPEIISPGYSIVSTFADNNATSFQCSSNNQTLNYGLLSMAGTSMATPVTAGAMALVRQYFAHGWYATGCVNTPPSGSNLTSISSALLRAMVINSGTRILGNYRDCAQASNCPSRALTYPGTDVYIYGFGRTNLANVLRMPGDAFTLKFWDISTGAGTGAQRLATGQTQTFNLVVQSSARDVKVTLVWTDPAGSASAAIKLVNDLDLTVTSPTGTVYLGNAYISLTNGARDSKNTVEQVIITNPPLGSYTITVKGTSVPTGPQDFAVVATAGGAPICSYGWVNGSWNTCGCEFSTQTRVVTCQSASGTVVADSFCYNGTSGTPKPPTARNCVGTVCPAAQKAWIGTWDYSSTICDPGACCCLSGPILISSAPLSTSTGSTVVTGTATSGSFFTQSNLTWTSPLNGLCNSKTHLSFQFAAQGSGSTQNLTFRYTNPAGYTATYRARIDTSGTMSLVPVTNTVPTVCGSTAAVSPGRSSSDDPSASGDGGSGPSVGLVVGVVIAVIAIALLIAAAVLYYRKKNSVPIALQQNKYPGTAATRTPAPAPAPANPYAAPPSQYPPQATYGVPPAGYAANPYPAQPQYAPQPAYPQYASQPAYSQYPSQPAYSQYPSQPQYASHPYPQAQPAPQPVFPAGGPPAYGQYTDEGLPEGMAAPVVPPRQAPALPPRSPPPVPPRGGAVEMNNLRS